MKNSIWMLISVTVLAISCQTKTEYDRIKERELASGKVYNDLFLDLHFEMGKKEFYGACWELNKQGVLTNGPHQLQIQYKPESPSGKEILMFFYPKFEEDKLFYMPMEFKYAAWLPSSEAFSNDHLMEDVKLILERWFGDGFVEVANKTKTVSVLAKIDGNRHIRVFKKNLSTVRAEILDLNVKDLKTMFDNDEKN